MKGLVGGPLLVWEAWGPGPLPPLKSGPVPKYPLLPFAMAKWPFKSSQRIWVEL